jgi:nitrogen-specific signal transduction histidine kinase/HD-like signal output (HDOD) protein
MAEKYIFRKIKQSNMFPQLPQVMLRLIKACNCEKTSVEELSEIISADPSLTSRLMQILGSTYSNLPKTVNSIKDAVAYLGKDTIQNIALSTAAMGFFNFSKAAPQPVIGKVWYHSYKCGVIARKMAEEDNFSNPEEFFLAGLLHDIGRLVLLQNFPDDYNAILQTSSNEKQTITAEMELFGADTPQVSAWLFSQWNLNPLISDAVFFINESIEQIEGALSHVKVVFISNFLARQDALKKIPNILCLTDIPTTRLEQIVIEAEKEVLEMAKSLDIKLVETQDSFYENSLTLEIKNLSLFYGTLQNLLHARDIETVLDIVHNGFKIIFNIPRVFYFLLDEKKDILTGFCSHNDNAHKIIKTIALPLSNKSSLLIKCIKELKVQNSLKTKPGQELAISDTQIIRLLKSKGLYCIPIYSSEKAAGIMVLGVDETTAKNLEDNKGLVKLFSKQTCVCIQGIRFYKDYAADVHEKKMEAYSTLTDKVIHEINNPISIIKNYIETLGLKLPDKHPAQDELLVINEEMNRVALLLDQLRNFSKPKIGGFELVDINQVCQRLLELLKKSILLPRQIEASINIDPEMPKVMTDLNGLKQVIINLVKNAAEAMDKGGEITLSTRVLSESQKILLDEKKQIPGSIELVISDNGPGIDENLKETLFEPYTTTKEGSSNSGLGLSIVHSIVKELNGKIRCETQPGKGTQFIITLPVHSSKNE